MRDKFYFLAVAIMVVFIFSQSQFILKPLVLAMLLSASINPLVERLQKIIKSHALSFIIVLGFFVTIFILIGFAIGGQLMALFSDLKGEKFEMANIESQLKNILGSYGFRVSDLSSSLSASLTNAFQGLGGILGTFLTAGGDSILKFFLTLILAYFLSSYYPGIRRQMLNVTAEGDSTKLKIVLSKAPNVIRLYLRGMGTVMLILAVTMTIVYWIIGVEYAIVWGALTGLLAFIPYVGSGISILLPISYSIISQGNFSQAILIVITFSIVQQLEGNFLTPKIVGNDVNMNPLAVIIVMLVAAKIWGLTGVLICIPVAAICLEILSLFPSTKSYAALMSSSLKSKKY